VQKEFLKNIFFLLFINVLIKPFYIIGIDAQVQNRVGDAAYGLYFAIFDFCFLFQVILDLGIQNYNSKYVSENRETVSEHFSYIIGLKIVLLLGFFMATFIGAIILDYPSSYYPLIGLMGLIMAFQTFYLYLRSHFSALGFYRTDTWLSIVDKVLMIVFVGYLLYGIGSINISTFMYAQIAALVVAVLVALFLLRKKFSFHIKFSPAQWKSTLKKSMPFALVFILMTLYTRMDGVMLERLIDDEAQSAGHYARGFRLMDAANMIGYLFAMLLLPMYARLLHEKKTVTSLLSTAAQIQFCITSIITLSCWFYAQDILDIIYKNNNNDIVQSFRLLMISFWTMAMSYIYGSLIIASGSLRSLNIIFVIGIVLNWTLNWFLIPQYMAIGAAGATLVTQIFVFLGQYIIVHRRYSIGFDGIIATKAIVLLGIYFVIGFMLYHYVQLYCLWELIIFVILSTLISFLSGFLRFNKSMLTYDTN
jgi:O-antigen/teichoic acid export membrane protein